MLAVVELVTRGIATETGAAFAIACVQVFRIADGQVKLFRGYAGPASL